MHKKKTIMLAAFACFALTMASCSKEHRCKCTTTDILDDGLLKILTIDGGLSCDDITEMGFEERYLDTLADPQVQSLHHVEMHKVSCRDYADEAVETE